MSDFREDVHPTLDLTVLGRIYSLVGVVLTSLPVVLAFSILLIYFALLTPYAYHLLGGHYDVRHLSSNFFLAGYNVFILFIIPALYCKFVFKDSLADFGLKLPANPRLATALIIVALCLLLPFMYYFSTQGNFKYAYTIPGDSTGKLFFVNLTVFPVYYFGEEFFFRGFLFLSLWRKVRWHSFWITDIFFTLAHITKPGMEILLCIPASIIFNCLTLATRSILPAWIVHFTMGTILFMLVNAKIS